MAYLSYNLPLHRTGFRPYGTTNTWAATQLGSVGAVRPRQIFSEQGGRRLLSGPPWPGDYEWPVYWQTQRAFSPQMLRGLGQAPAICLDENENSISCLDPNCALGDCGSTAPQQTVGALCLDENENAIDCTSPNCAHGDCSGPANIKPTLAPGSSPRVAAPVTLFPATSPLAPPTATPRTGCAAGYTLNPTTMQCVAPSSWTQYLPLIAVGAVVVGLMMKK